MRPILYLIYFILPAFIIGFVSGYQYIHNQNQYLTWFNTWTREWYGSWYDAWMCAIVRTVTWRSKCEVRELQTGSGKTRKAAISLPE